MVLLEIISASVATPSKKRKRLRAVSFLFQSSLIRNNLQGRPVQLPGIPQKAVEIPQGRGKVEAVHNPLVGDKTAVHILLPHHRTVPPGLIDPPFPAKGAEHRHIAEVIEMVVNRRDPQGRHGGDEQRSVEGGKFRQKPGQEAKVVQNLQKQHKQPQHGAGNQVHHPGQPVKTAVQRRFLHLPDLGVEFLIHHIRRIRRVKGHFDHCIRRTGQDGFIKRNPAADRPLRQ